MLLCVENVRESSKAARQQRWEGGGMDHVFGCLGRTPQSRRSVSLGSQHDYFSRQPPALPSCYSTALQQSSSSSTARISSLASVRLGMVLHLHLHLYQDQPGLS